jgi:acetolactate synthase-1/2/3 large subunit
MSSPDFVRLGQAYGMCSMRATNLQEAREIIQRAREHDGPVLMEFVVEQETNVFPMVQPGKALNEMTRREIPMPAAMGGGMEGVKE